MTYHRWSQDEIDHLETLTGDVPFAVLVKSMRCAARQHGWPVRSAKSIATRMTRTDQHRRARTGEWTSSYGAAEILGCPGSRVNEWIRQPKIREVLDPRVVGTCRYVTRASWRRLARVIPRVLGGFSADALFLLLEDRQLAESVAAQYPQTMGDWRIRCVETGQIWPSCCAAARELNVSRNAISKAILNARPVWCLGMTFEALRGARPSVPLQAAPNESDHGSPLTEDGTTEPVERRR
jgi:hypothetical protein